MISKHVQSISKKGNGHLGLTVPHATLDQTLMLSSDEQDPVLMGDMVVVSEREGGIVKRYIFHLVITIGYTIVVSPFEYP